MNAIALLLCAVVTIPSIPDVIARLRPGLPVWVSARSAFNADGELRADLFPGNVAMLTRLRRANSDRCHQYIPPPILEDFTPKNSLDALVGYSLTIIKARVVAGDVGFDNGDTPGTLFALRVDETYKSIGNAATDGTLYLFIGEAAIPTPKGYICAKSFSTVPLPAVGDDVIVFCSLTPIDDEQRILHIEPSRQFVLEHAGRVYLPRLTDRPAPANIDELGALIRANPHLHDAHPRTFF